MLWRIFAVTGNSADTMFMNMHTMSVAANSVGLNIIEKSTICSPQLSMSQILLLNTSPESNKKSIHLLAVKSSVALMAKPRIPPMSVSSIFSDST